MICVYVIGRFPPGDHSTAAKDYALTTGNSIPLGFPRSKKNSRHNRYFFVFLKVILFLIATKQNSLRLNASCRAFTT